MKNTIIISIVIAVLVGGGAFYAGSQYGKSQATSAISQARLQRNGGQGGLPGGQFNRSGRGGANFVSGDIIAKDDASIIVKDWNGGSKIIFLSGNTQISKFTAGSAANLTVGQSVTANGTANSDGSITAQMIQLRPVNATSTPEQ